MAPFVREAGAEHTDTLPVLCLHANASSSSQWRALMDLLAPRHRVLAPDLLGAGRSARWPQVAGARLHHELDALSDVLDGLGDRFHLVGHSYGGAVAMRIALTWPDRVASLLLYEPTMFPLLGQPHPGQPGAIGISAVAAAAIAEVERGNLQAAAAGFIDYWMGAGAWAAMPEARRGPLAESMRPIRQWTDAIFAEPWSLADLAGLALPVLLLGGALSPASASDLLPILARLLPNATLQRLEGVGHMAPVTHPHRVDPLIVQWLDGQA